MAPTWRDDLARLAEEVAEDRAVLRRLMHRLGVAVNRPMTALGYVAERAGRFKPNGYVLRRSPLTDVIELEALRDAVAAKLAGWQVLRAVAAHDQRVTRDEVEDMLERAQDQADRLYRLHLRVTETALAATEPAS